ncbi:hypothetical protein E1B28_010014 [Marasmius oreades]|uniref:DUF218 domain-containing protein n=1 Tax=Marasmius oreades TaxID=181124 RepID=A0A9P7RWE0_9AGAR|nr:uncharacterized protein E1B28_010014 [Marasmius oreades]KAG7090942.1 hypothetical protein E1B28_010014 [Marasmius oreades]
MLPTPVSLSKRKPFRRETQRLRLLLTRARITNLGVLLLFLFALASVVLNLTYWLTWPLPITSYPHSILSTISRRQFEGLDHLIVVPGHAIWIGSKAEDRFNDDLWTLESYQKQGGRPEAFFKHISKGVELANEDNSSLVVFSGGQTRPSSTTTEGESYLRLALQANLFRTSIPNQPLRATTENYALDSYQNFLFSIARFQEYTGHYPRQITIVGYEMKRKRFEELHRAALRWPNDRFQYVGINLNRDEDAVVAEMGENLNGFLPYSRDLYGCHSELLLKRKARNAFSRFHPYHTSSPELRQLMDWCPHDGDATALFTGPLPWD